MKAAEPDWAAAMEALDRLYSGPRHVLSHKLHKAGTRVARARHERHEPGVLRTLSAPHAGTLAGYEHNWNQGFAVGYLLAIEEQRKAVSK